MASGMSNRRRKEPEGKETKKHEKGETPPFERSEDRTLRKGRKTPSGGRHARGY